MPSPTPIGTRASTLRRRLGEGLFLVGALHQLPDIPPAIIRELYFPYTAGADAMRRVLSGQGVEAVNGYLTEPPPATTLILHPELLTTGWEPERIPDSSLLREQVGESLGPAWELRLTGSLGEFHLLNYLLGDARYYSGWLRAPGNQTAVEAAEGWAGDRYYLFGNGQATVMTLRVRFNGPEDAREFAEAHRAIATGGGESRGARRSDDRDAGRRRRGRPPRTSGSRSGLRHRHERGGRARGP